MAMQTARRGEPLCSLNFRDKPIASAKTSASSRSQSTRINHRPAAGEMLSRAGRFHALFYTFSRKSQNAKSQCEQRAAKNRAALRIFAITSAKTSASSRSQYAHKPSPRRRRNALLRSRAFSLFNFTIFHQNPEEKKPMRRSANSMAGRTSLLSEFPRQANSQRQDERFSPFSICAKPSPRRTFFRPVPSESDRARFPNSQLQPKAIFKKKPEFNRSEIV